MLQLIRHKEVTGTWMRSSVVKCPMCNRTLVCYGQALLVCHCGIKLPNITDLETKIESRKSFYSFGGMYFSKFWGE